VNFNLGPVHLGPAHLGHAHFGPPTVATPTFTPPTLTHIVHRQNARQKVRQNGATNGATNEAATLTAATNGATNWATKRSYKTELHGEWRRVVAAARQLCPTVFHHSAVCLWLVLSKLVRTFSSWCQELSSRLNLRVSAAVNVELACKYLDIMSIALEFITRWFD